MKAGINGMIHHTIQWFRNYWFKEVKALPKKKYEDSFLKSLLQGRQIVPNPHGWAFFCFPCGEYIVDDDLEKHDALRKHIENSKRWHKEMGYLYTGPK
jgi:hypothetical protein